MNDITHEVSLRDQWGALRSEYLEDLQTAVSGEDAKQAGH